MKHDRTIINERGGIWPALADAVRADAKAIAASEPPVPPVILPQVKPYERDELTQRRKALGLTIRWFAHAAQIPTSTVHSVESGRSGIEAFRRYRAAIDELEANQ